MAFHYTLIMEDGSQRGITCNLDADMHTSVHVRQQLQHYSQSMYRDAVAVKEFRYRRSSRRTAV